VVEPHSPAALSLDYLIPLLFHYVHAGKLQYHYEISMRDSRSTASWVGMECVRLTYEVMSTPGRKEHYIAFQPGQASPRDLAAALMRHEFPSVAFPFGQNGEMQADEVLKRHGIVNVTYSMMRRDMEPAS
jgi:hypothetical protein